MSSARGYLRLTGMILLRVSSVAPCREMARRNCSGSSASCRICGARPLVEMVILRAPIPPPQGALRMRKRPEQVVVIGQRFAHAHDDEVVDESGRGGRLVMRVVVRGVRLRRRGSSSALALGTWHSIVRRPGPGPRFPRRAGCVSSRPGRWRRICSRRRSRPGWRRRGCGGRWARRRGRGWRG